MDVIKVCGQYLSVPRGRGSPTLYTDYESMYTQVSTTDKSLAYVW